MGLLVDGWGANVLSEHFLRVAAKYFGGQPAKPIGDGADTFFHQSAASVVVFDGVDTAALSAGVSEILRICGKGTGVFAEAALVAFER